MIDSNTKDTAFVKAVRDEWDGILRLIFEREDQALLRDGRKPLDSTLSRKGIGGAPTRATTLPSDPKERKTYPIASGLMDYFPDALVAVSHVSWQGNEQHNPGQPMHWARGKSTDEADTMLRHFLERGKLDKDGIRHTAKMVWRALALLQKEIEAEQAQYPQYTNEPTGAPSLVNRTAPGTGYKVPNLCGESMGYSLKSNEIVKCNKPAGHDGHHAHYHTGATK